MISMARFALSFRSLLAGAWSTLGAGIDELFPSLVEEELKAAREKGWQVDEAEAYCHRCGASAGPGEATERGCSQCLGKVVAWDRIIRLGLYTPPLASWIVAMKFHRQWTWGPWLGRALAAQIQPQEDRAKSIVVPVPSPLLRRWRRGYSQTHLIAGAFAAALKWRMAELLHRKGWQRPQTRVLASHRGLNVRDAFRLDAVDLAGYEIWLVDDVKTSGSTLTVCAKLLRQAGAAKVNVAVAAVADPRHMDFKLI